MLLVFPLTPFPITRGVHQRLYYLARELSRYHSLDLFCLDEEQDPASLEGLKPYFERIHLHPFRHPPWPKFFFDRLLSPTPTTVRHWRCQHAHRALLEFTADQNYAAIHFVDLAMWQYVCELLPGVPKVCDRTRVDSCYQLEILRQAPFSLRDRAVRWENLWKLRRYEQRASAHWDATIVGGGDDLEYLRASFPETGLVKVLPNGVDPGYFCPQDWPLQPDPEPTLLFCGAMDYSPNIGALEWYFDRCDAQVRQNFPGRKILIVGRSPVTSVQQYSTIPGVTVTGEVADVRPYYQRAWLQMVPLLVGGGSRLKIPESLALEVPVVSSRIGAQGLNLSHGRDLWLADTPADFSLALVTLLNRPDLRTELGRGGRAQVLQTLTWERLGGQLARFYGQLVGRVAA